MQEPMALKQSKCPWRLCMIRTKATTWSLWWHSSLSLFSFCLTVVVLVQFVNLKVVWLACFMFYTQKKPNKYCFTFSLRWQSLHTLACTKDIQCRAFYVSHIIFIFHSEEEYIYLLFFISVGWVLILNKYSLSGLLCGLFSSFGTKKFI